jgi:hypothetical protein
MVVSFCENGNEHAGYTEAGIFGMPEQLLTF